MGQKTDSPLDGTRTHLWHPWVLLPRQSTGLALAFTHVCRQGPRQSALGIKVSMRGYFIPP